MVTGFAIVASISADASNFSKFISKAQQRDFPQVGGSAYDGNIDALNALVHLEKEFMIVALLYLVLAGAYLLAIPVAIMLYLKQRWYVASSIERTVMYFMVFLFLPGLLVLSPFVNLRPRPRQIEV